MAGYTRFDDPAPNAAKSGEGYDRCPVDGCVEVDPFYTIGGVDGHGGGHYDAFLYSADPRQHGCGAAWTRTTAQGAARDHAHGVDSKYLTQSADRGRVISIPSPQFSENYARIFGHS